MTTGDGTIHWKVGNIAIYSPTTDMKYEMTYRWGNWTIYHDAKGTRLAHIRTGHGMFVSIENVYPF